MTIVTTHYRYKRLPPGCWKLMVSGLCVMIGLAITEPVLSAGNTFDGVYAGKRVLTKGPNRACPTEDDVSVTIKGSALQVTTSRLRAHPMGFNAHPDGSFGQISSGGPGGYLVFIRGRIRGDVLDADVADRNCEHHWHLTRTGSP
jgi:hypothetical protein